MYCSRSVSKLIRLKELGGRSKLHCLNKQLFDRFAFGFRTTSMAFTDDQKKISPAKYAYTIIYVRDVEKAARFYSQAFAFNVRRVDNSRRWAELETGPTTIAFTPLNQRETRITGGVQTPPLDEPRHNVEISFSFPDVDAAFQHAVNVGALPVAEPELKEWGQKVAYVRDPDGVVIRLGSDISGQ
ncbi:hypothetical protein O6H91_04G032400 [Diphasiastrum complanatum]|uniref:Uncharacterized protein n=1 Tax=Diphasiastrum complanatum TaxID=34168 RepID=A0ACC2DVQ7_DIPCM|nr:hypothetical protein O6H91_04G032400 [Diphasiastrum complanatum]